jgi:FkbM family methyltransferase
MSGPLPSVMTRKPTLAEHGLSLLFRLLPVKHGAHRLLDRLRPAAWVKGPSMVDVPYRGHTVQIDVSDLVGWHFLVMRNFDPEITEVLRRFACRDGMDVFWDIGANKGALSYEMAASLPRCRIVAVEPQRCMTSLLQENLETLARGRHEVFAVGIGEIPGTFELVIAPENRGCASLTTAKRDGSLVEHVAIVTADTVRRQSRYGWPTVVKIDVEGAEAAVIRSLRPAFKARHIRCCVFECHASQEWCFQQIRSATESFGYGLYAITKTPFSTRLVSAARLVRAATDYALIRDDLHGSAARCSPPRREGGRSLRHAHAMGPRGAGPSRRLVARTGLSGWRRRPGWKGM